MLELQLFKHLRSAWALKVNYLQQVRVKFKKKSQVNDARLYNDFRRKSKAFIDMDKKVRKSIYRSVKKKLYPQYIWHVKSVVYVSRNCPTSRKYERWSNIFWRFLTNVPLHLWRIAPSLNVKL